MAAIEINGVTKRYHHVTVLQNIELTVAAGEFVVLVGPSGCGKSTLLRMIAGLDEISSGEIRIGGRVVSDLPPRARDIAMVFQSYALYPHLSVADNMGYSLKLRRTPKERITQAITAAAETLGLGQLLARKPRQLSGGQRQRVAMGRAIVRQPKAFLFDEPLSNLDARLREQMRGEIKALHRSLGATSVYVTHDQIEAMTLADRIVAMNGGAIQQVGSPLELYDRPANLFVAGFIGSPGMNTLAVRRHGAALVSADGTTLAPATAGIADGQPLTLGIRPEHVILGQGTLSGRIDLLEPTGLGTIVHLTLADHPVKVFTLARLPLAIGETIALDLPADKLHLFDAQGDRITTAA